MPPKKRNRKHFDIDEYIPTESNQRKAQHSDYEMQGKATHSFLPVPTTNSVLSGPVLSTLPIPTVSGVYPFEDDEYSNLEEGDREMEAMGFGGILTHPKLPVDSLETRRRQRTQGVSE